MLFLGIFSGLAGVYNEWILKKHYSESLHLQNIYLYSYGVILNIIPAVVTSRSVDFLNPFQFYSDKNKIIQILVNLIQNARDALIIDKSGRPKNMSIKTKVH